MHRTRSFNRPSPLAGLLFQAKGNYGEWQVGGKPWFLPLNHLSIGSCHHGSISPQPEEPVELWAVAFNLKGIAEFNYLWEDPVRDTIAVSNPSRLITAFEKVAICYLNRYNRDPLFLKGAVLELLATARGEFHHRPLQEHRPEAVKKVIQWLDRNFHEPDTTLADLADIAELSIHHFGRTFSAVMEKSAMCYLRELRLRHSCSLLLGTELRISEIAFAVGFRDPLHFSRVFRQYTGKSPRQYRQLENSK